MEIIDFHAHIYPDKIAEKASQATGDFYGITPAYSGTSEELLFSGKAAGISRFVLLPVATKADQVRHINEFIADEVSAHREFYGFGTLHPDCKNILEETEHIVDLGLKGIKLHPARKKKAAVKKAKSLTAANIKKDPTTVPKKKAAAIKDQMNHSLPTAARMRKAQKFLIAAEVNIQLIL